jgi:phage terminase Nu1 subunit (DNA packaging protein)
MVLNEIRAHSPEADKSPSRLLTKEQLSAFLGVTQRTVENLQRKGLPFYRIGPRRNRYDPKSVAAWLDRSCRVTVVGGAD